MQLSSNHHIEGLVHDHSLDIGASTNPRVISQREHEASEDFPDPFYLDVDLNDLVSVDDFAHLDEIQGYLDETQPEECFHCELAPCIWSVHSAQMVEYAEVVLVVDPTDNARELSSKRKALYRQMSHLLNGHLGRGNRKPHTECVKQGIRDIFPDPNGQFMGHRDA